MSLELLRAATRQDHQRLEERLCIPARCATLPSYQSLLARFYGFYHPYEASLKRAGNLFPRDLEMSSRTRLPQLASDLRAMGVTENGIEHLPHCPDIPRPQTSAEALGCLYVTEGSTLGGQIIRRMIQETFGTDAPTTAFFDGYGAQTGARWRALCAAIDGAEWTRDERDAMAQSARGAFQILEAWLCAEPHAPSDQEED